MESFFSENENTIILPPEETIHDKERNEILFAVAELEFLQLLESGEFPSFDEAKKRDGSVGEGRRGGHGSPLLAWRIA